jgi:hypothetical protein
MDVRLTTAKHREEAQLIDVIDVYKYDQRALSAITTLSESCPASIVARTWEGTGRAAPTKPLGDVALRSSRIR